MALAFGSSDLPSMMTRLFDFMFLFLVIAVRILRNSEHVFKNRICEVNAVCISRNVFCSNWSKEIWSHFCFRRKDK